MTSLSTITQQILTCPYCRDHTSEQLVPGEGDEHARIMIVGEAPGKQEAATGRPFVGRSGQLLTKLLAEIGLAREQIFITSALKYFPGKHRITVSEIAHGITHLSQQIATINPSVIICLGAISTQAVLGNKLPIQKVHGQIFSLDDRQVFVTFHPAAALRFSKLLPTLRADFSLLQKILQ